MVFVGDFFAIGLIIVLCMFYFERKHFLSFNSRIFAVSLFSIGLTACTNIFCYGIMSDPATPLWMLHLFNSLYFFFLITSTMLRPCSCFTAFWNMAAPAPAVFTVR